MSTVTVEQYRVWTGDSTSSSALVEPLLDVAESLVEEYLRRPLASVERTEEYKVWTGGIVYPKAVPVTSVQASATYSVEDTATIKYVTPDDVTSEVVGDRLTASDDYPHSLPKATVTYVGGWTSITLPPSIARIVSLAAKALLAPASVADPTVTKQAVGDVSITRDAASSTGHGIDVLVPLSSQLLHGYVWRPL